MKPPTTITLEDHEYRIQQLTLGQIEDLNLIIAPTLPVEPGAATKENYERMIAVIVGALGKQYPEITAERVRDMRITLLELRAAWQEILDYSDLVKKRDIATIEAAVASGEPTAVARAA